MTLKRSRMRLGLILGLALFPSLSACRTVPEQEPQANKEQSFEAVPLPSDPKLERTVLANGATYLSRPMRISDQVAMLSLVVRTGAWAEEKREWGFAHLVEHLAFRQTENFSNAQQNAFIAQLGMTRGADVNAYTAAEHTRYDLVVPTSDPAMMAHAVLLLRDWATGVLFDQPNIDAERNIVLGEIRAGATVRRQLREQTQERAMLGSPLAFRSLMGTPESLRKATSAGLSGFFHKWYHPENMAIVVAGKFDSELLRELAKAAFQSIPRASNGAVRTPTELPVNGGRTLHFSVLREPGFPSVVKVLLKRHALAFKTENDARLGVLDDVLGRIVRKRLERLPSLRNSPLLKTFGGLDGTLPRPLRGLQLSATIRSSQIDQAPAMLLRELRRLELYPVSLIEIDQARAEAMEEFVSRLKRSSVGDVQADLVQSFITGNSVVGADNMGVLGTRFLTELTEDSVNAHRSQWLKKSERHVIVSSSKDGPLITAKRLGEISAAVELEKLRPYRPTIPLTKLLSDLPARGAITKSQSIEAIDARVWTLGNGATVVFKRNRNDRLLRLYAFGPGGLARRGNVSVEAARLAPGAIAASGLGASSAVAVAQLLGAEQVELKPWIDGYEEGFTGQAPADRVETLLQAVHLMSRSPGQDKQGFDAFRSRHRERAIQSRRIAQWRFLSEASQALWQGHPWHTQLTPEAADSLELDASRDFFRSRFGDVGDFTFLLVGSMAPESLEPLIARYLASLLGTRRQERTSHPVAVTRSGVTQVRVTGGPANKASVNIEFHDSGDFASNNRAMLKLVEKALQRRLMAELREKTQAVYAVKTWSAPMAPPDHGHTLELTFDCEPARVKDLSAIAFRVASELGRKDLSAKAFRELLLQFGGDEKGKRLDSDFWLTELAEVFRRGESPNDLLVSRQPVTTASPTQLRRAAAALLPANQYVYALLTPEPHPQGTNTGP